MDYNRPTISKANHQQFSRIPLTPTPTPTPPRRGPLPLPKTNNPPESRVHLNNNAVSIANRTNQFRISTSTSTTAKPYHSPTLSLPSLLPSALTALIGGISILLYTIYHCASPAYKRSMLLSLFLTLFIVVLTAVPNLKSQLGAQGDDDDEDSEGKAKGKWGKGKGQKGVEIPKGLAKGLVKLEMEMRETKMENEKALRMEKEKGKAKQKEGPSHYCWHRQCHIRVEDVQVVRASGARARPSTGGS